MTIPQLPAPSSPVPSRLLTADAFHRLADVPPEVEWVANLTNCCTRRAYDNAIKDFMRFTGIVQPEEFCTVTHAHVIAWGDDLAQRNLSRMALRHRLAALSSLFQYRCERNALTHKPVKGAKSIGKPCAGKLHARFDEGGPAKACPLLYPLAVRQAVVDSHALKLDLHHRSRSLQRDPARSHRKRQTNSQ